jgi:uncharacterized protein (TIGR03067 family)
LAGTTIRAAALFAAGEGAAAGAVPVKAAALAKGVSRTMFVTKLKTWLAVLLAGGMIGVVGVFAALPPAAEKPETKKEAPKPAAASAEQPKEAAVKTDREKIQGSWALVSSEAGDRKSSAEEVKKSATKLEFAGEKVLVAQGDGSQLATFRLDPAKEPKEIDLVLLKTEVHKGIYKLDGDTLTICKSHPPEERPAEFATTKGSKWPMVLVFKRSGESDHAKLQGTWTVTASEVDGKPAEKRKGDKFVIAGKKITVRQEGQADQGIAFKLDPFASPKAADLTALDGKQKGTTLSAIYALDGDTLKLCVSFEEQRPAEFAAPPGRKMQTFVLKRDKDK